MRLKFLAVVPARGGSKGLPGKNLMRIKGETLIQMAAQTINEANFFDLAVCSTDDSHIALEAAQYGLLVPGLRPAHLATDEASTAAVVIDLLETLRLQKQEFDCVFVIQPTSPTLIASDLIKAKQMMETGLFASIMSGFKVPSNFHPSAMFTLDSGQLATPLLANGLQPIRRQDMSSILVRSGLVYAALVPQVLSQTSLLPHPTAALEVPFSRAISIDTELDFIAAKKLIERDSFGQQG